MAEFPTSASLLDDARALTGLDDFGAGDFRQGLDVLLESLERDSDLSSAATGGAVDLLRRRLVNRLEIEEWFRTHPGIADAKIDGPVSVMGLPRTGTTALGNMLSLDDQFRPLRMWEQAAPCPPPTPETEADDPRRTALVKQFAEVPEEMKAMHIFEVDAATEDTEVLGLGFRAQQMTLPVYGYHDWWRDTDMTDTYAYHRRVALLLQSQRPPNRWLFKAPHHKFHLDALVSAYPEARFVMTHRDPAKTVASYANFVASLYPPEWRAAHDPAVLGQHISNHLRIGTERAIEARQRLGDGRFLDVHHRDFLRDPEGTIDSVYSFLGLELRPAVKNGMSRWQEANRSSAHGRHRYTAEEYGLSADQLRSDFAPYIEHFAVELED